MHFRLFMDESGDHSVPRQCDPSTRYLGLLGVVFAREHYDAFVPKFDAYRAEHFGHCAATPVILHRSDMVNTRGPFVVLRDPDRKAKADRALLSLIDESQCTLISVVVDKKNYYCERGHPKVRGTPIEDAYECSLTLMFERFVPRLVKRNARGDATIEARGRKFDNRLRRAFSAMRKTGSKYLKPAHVQAALSPPELHFVAKSAGHPGLQLADLLAQVATRECLVAYHRLAEHRGTFDPQLAEVMSGKWHRSMRDGHVLGYGMKLRD